MARSRLTVAMMILGLCLGLSVDLTAQNPPSIPDDDAFRPSRYDSAHETLFFGAGVLRKNTTPIHAYDLNGVRRGADIDLFKDFPTLDHALVDGLAAGPDGKTVIAGALNFGAKKLRHVILTYSASGALLEAWNTEPYGHEAVATDEAGNVFALGTRLDEGAGIKPPYPLLVEYSPSGKVLNESLSSSLFKNGPDAIDSGPNTFWDPLMTVRNNHILIYAPQEAEFLVCSMQGAIIQRLSLSSVLTDMADADGAKTIEVRNVVFRDDKSVVLDLTEYMGSNKLPIQSTIIIDSQSVKYKVTISAIIRTWTAFGAKDDKLLVLSHDSKDAESIKSYDLLQ